MSGSAWFVMAFLAVAFAERLSQSFSRKAVEPGEQRMRWSLYALYASYTVIVFGAGVECFLARRPLWAWVSALGVALYLTSLALRKMAIRTLGKFWSLQVEIRAEHQLVRQGVYRFLRHPIYASIILEVLSIPLVANAWATLAFAGLVHVPLVLFRMRYEERAMVEKLGDAYRGYQREVGALVPRWSAFRRGESVS